MFTCWAGDELARFKALMRERLQANPRGALMLLAREAGLHTCAQEAWVQWHKTVGEFLGLPDHLMLFCGLAMGYADLDHPVSGLRTARAALEEFATLKGL